MLTIKTIATTAAALAFLAIGMQSANAAPNGSRFEGRQANVAIINARIQNQSSRIRLGQATGRLSYVGARKAQFELSHIRGFRARYLSDGWLSHREARHLDRLLNDNARRIRFFATNGIGRRPVGRPFRATLSRFNGFR